MMKYEQISKNLMFVALAMDEISGNISEEERVKMEELPEAPSSSTVPRSRKCSFKALYSKKRKKSIRRARDKRSNKEANSQRRARWVQENFRCVGGNTPVKHRKFQIRLKSLLDEGKITPISEAPAD